MHIRSHTMRPDDVLGCVEVVRADPVVAPRYGSAISDLGNALLRVMDRAAFGADVFEEVENLHIRKLGAGVAVFVSDEFVRELKTGSFWTGPELVRRTVRGDSPLLSDKALQVANSSSGLNLVVWLSTVSAEHYRRPEVATGVMTAFVERFRGYRINELINQAESVEHLYAMRKAGGFYLNAKGSYGDFPDLDSHEVARCPHSVGITSEIARTQPGSWVGSLFLYGPPRCGFSKGEQRMLLAALNGDTDEELAGTLAISVSAVKKTWRSIYDRAAVSLPEVIPHKAESDAFATDRGKEKKRRLLAYLRQHPEELRPVSRKLLQRQI